MALPDYAAEPAARSAARTLPRWLRSLIGSPGVLPSVLVCLLLVLAALFAEQLAPYDPLAVELKLRLKPPGTEGFVLGTDALGRDLLSRIIYGARISLAVGFFSAVVSASVGTVLGLIAGYFRGRTEMIIMRLGDLQLGLPSFLLAIALMAALGSGLWNVILAISVSGWVTYARVTRSQVLSLRERDFVQAALSMGATHRRIIFLHILPHCISPLLIISSFHIASAILTESSLSFLGLGVSPETPTWGAILAEGRSYMRDAWWVTTLPGLALLLTVLCVNVLGDWMRDYLDPRIRRSGTKKW